MARTDIIFPVCHQDRHVSEAEKHCAGLTDHTGRIFEQTLEHTDEMAEFGQEHFSEGENRLEVWMTDEDGKELEEFRFQKTFQIDRKAPVISMQAPQGFDHWYAGEVSLLVKAADGAAGSGWQGSGAVPTGRFWGRPVRRKRRLPYLSFRRTVNRCVWKCGQWIMREMWPGRSVSF